MTRADSWLARQEGRDVAQQFDHHDLVHAGDGFEEQGSVAAAETDHQHALGLRRTRAGQRPGLVDTLGREEAVDFAADPEQTFLFVRAGNVGQRQDAVARFGDDRCLSHASLVQTRIELSPSRGQQDAEQQDKSKARQSG